MVAIRFYVESDGLDKLSIGIFSNWCEHVNVTYSYVNSTQFFDLDCFYMRVAIRFYVGIKNNLLGLMVLDKLSIVSGKFSNLETFPR